MVEAITAAAIAAVDRYLAHMGLYPRSEPVSSHDLVNNNRPLVASASVARAPPPAGSVATTTHPAAVSTNNAYPFVAPAPIPAPLPPADSVAPTANPAPAPSRIAPPPATSFDLALDGPLAPAPTDKRILHDDSSSQASKTSSSLGLRADFVANLQAAYRTLDMRRVPRVQPL